MKIGLFFDTYYPQKNGVATSGVYLTQALRKKGYQVSVVLPAIKGHIDLDPDVLRIPSMRVWPTIPDSVRMPTLTPSRIWQKIFNLDYDIIHADGNGFFSLIGLFVARRKKIPYIFTFHTLFSHYTHYFLKGKLLTPNLVNFGLKKFGNLCDGIIAPSEKMKDELIKIGIKKPIEVIPSFIDLDKFHISKKGFLHQKYKIPKQHKILLSVGRLEKEKNFEFVIKVFQQVARNNLNVHLVIAGEGSNRKNLEKQISDFKLEKKVHLIGDIDMYTMPKVYQDADIFVFASFAETQGLCVLEAAASGLSLVLVNDSAYKGMIADKKNGFSLPLDAIQFVDKIILLLKDSKTRQMFGEKSKQIVRSNFEEGQLVDKLIELYKSYISRNTHRNL